MDKPVAAPVFEDGVRSSLRFLQLDELLDLRDELADELRARGCSDLIGPERSEGPRLSTPTTTRDRGVGR